MNITLTDNSSLPDSFDWRKLGAVTPVKDQGSVGSCWTFSTTGNVEGVNFLATKNLVSLSEEQIVDCDSTIDPFNNHADCGVFGGWPYLAMQFVINSGGLEPESNYPYCVGTGKCYPCPANGYNETRCGPPVSYCNATKYPCQTVRTPQAITIDSWTSIDQDEDVVAQALMMNGPLSVLMNAQMLQFYRSGVWNPSRCSPTSLDHAVLIVGFGTDP